MSVLTLQQTALLLEMIRIQNEYLSEERLSMIKSMLVVAALGIGLYLGTRFVPAITRRGW